MSTRPRTMAERDEARMKREATTQELYGHIARKGEAFTKGDTFQSFLESMIHFHHYSGNNQFLIYFQRPDAVQVNAYKRWQALGRQVRKGEKGIRILAPRVVTTTEHNSRTGQDEEQSRTYYIPVSVFDVSQTDPIPDFDGTPWEPMRYPTLNDNSGQDHYNNITAWLIDQGIPVVHDAYHDTPGTYVPDTLTVYVSAEPSPLDRLRTLIHEAAHALHHDEDERDLRTQTRQYAEIVAESSSYVVMHALGFDSADHASQYIGVNGHIDPDAIDTALPMIQRVTHRLLDAISA